MNGHTSQSATPEGPRSRSLEFGVYVHFPWCLSKCPYCDFVAYASPRDAIDHAGYADAVLAELSVRESDVSRGTLATVFFGGGTPSLWQPSEIARVLSGVLTTFRPSSSGVEVSLECDPSSLDYDTARALVDAGVNRLSIGVQALDDERLRFLGRIHTSREAKSAISEAVRARVPRVSADLMYAVAGQRPEQVAAEARELHLLGATHVSAYSLTIEPDTPFGNLARRGRLPLSDDAAAAESFFAIDEALERAGLEHYEVSNYASPGQKARHNLGYWRGNDYVGLGTGAYGTISRDDGTARRYRNHPNPRTYLTRCGSGAGAFTSSEEELDPATRFRERIMLGLRMKEGLDFERAAAELGVDAYASKRLALVDTLVTRGRLVRSGARIAVPRDAWIWADDTAARLF